MVRGAIQKVRGNGGEHLIRNEQRPSESLPLPSRSPFTLCFFVIIPAVERRYRISSTITLTCFISILLSLSGCSSKPRLAGVHFAIASGSHTLLPSVQQPILIWADPPLTNMAKEWLQSHHYSHVLLPHPDPLTPPPISHTSSNRQAALALAKEMHAEFVLILEREELKDEALIQTSCGALFNINIDVRGLSVERGESVLRGNAHYPHCVEHSDKTVRNLTCQALATAWGFRPSGQLEIPSHLACTAGQTTPAPIH